jgi:alpha-L-rhamnosidase
MSAILAGETYDATQDAAVAGWSTAGYTGESTYFTTSVATESLIKTQMVSQPTDPIAVVRSVQPVDVWTNTDQSQFMRIYDFGQNIVGFCALSISNTNQLGGTTVSLHYGESLKTNISNLQFRGADVDFSSLRDPTLQQDTYKMSSAQQQQFQPHFTYHGFRFVQVSAVTQSVPPSVEMKGFKMYHLGGCRRATH